jgi:ferrous-iron efflux pump FieF
VLHESDARARRAALNVSGVALLLAIAKTIVGLSAGSIAVLSSALDSAGDMLASFANFVFLTIAAKPPDEGHHFGHGKAEHLATMLQGVVLMAGAIEIGIKAIERIRMPHAIESGEVAIVTMIGSTIVTIFIARYLRRNATQADSTALAGDAMHYTSDYLANGATIAALIIVRITGNPLWDSILGLSVAGWIAWSSLYLLWNAGAALMDPALPEEEIARIVEAIEKCDPEVVGYRDLRTRRAGGMRFIEFDLCIDRSVSFEVAHDVSERVKQRIFEMFKRVVVTVHAEPVSKQPAS